MESKEIPFKYLQDMGFEEISPRLFAKRMSPHCILYRDYRETAPHSYAYFKGRKIDPSIFKETRAIEKLEMIYFKGNTLKAFI